MYFVHLKNPTLISMYLIIRYFWKWWYHCYCVWNGKSKHLLPKGMNYIYLFNLCVSSEKN